MPYTKQFPFHLLLKTCLLWVAVHASGWTLRPGSRLTGSCCGVLTQHSQTISIAGWACSHCCAWYILHLTYVHVMLCCNCHLPHCEHHLLINLEINCSWQYQMLHFAVMHMGCATCVADMLSVRVSCLLRMKVRMLSMLSVVVLLAQSHAQYRVQSYKCHVGCT